MVIHQPATRSLIGCASCACELIDKSAPELNKTLSQCGQHSSHMQWTNDKCVSMGHGHGCCRRKKQRQHCTLYRQRQKGCRQSAAQKPITYEMIDSIDTIYGISIFRYYVQWWFPQRPPAPHTHTHNTENIRSK